VAQAGGDFGQRLQHEQPLMQARMRNHETRLFED
jgi:hypothetical protein